MNIANFTKAASRKGRIAKSLAGIFTCMAMLFGFVGTFLTGGGVAEAFDKDDLEYVQVEELWDSESKSFKKDELVQLFKFITGDEAVSDVSTAQKGLELVDKRLSRGNVTSYDMEISPVSGKEYGKDIFVKLGGMNWSPTYLSKDKNGNDILTLWLTNSSQLDTKGYDSTGNKTYTSSGAVWWCGYSGTVNSYDVKWPDNLYGISYMRAVVLNNGGGWKNGHWKAGTSNVENTELTPYEQWDGNAFAAYTMDLNEGEMNDISDFIVTPRDVSWQEDGQYAKDMIAVSNNLPNENWSPYIDNAGFVSANTNYANRENNDTWADDKLWLPSLTETGYDLVNGVGIWQTSTAQRKNITTTWLRSGFAGVPHSGYFFGPNGLDLAWRTDGWSAVSFAFGVRPALHLNLNSAALSADSGADGAAANTDIGYAGVENIEPQDCTGEAVSPEPKLVVTAKAEDGINQTSATVLQKGQDYTIEKWENNTKSGTASIVIKGSGSYSGTRTVYYQIKPDATEKLPEIWNGISNTFYKKNVINMLDSLFDTHDATALENLAQGRLSADFFKTTAMVEMGGLPWNPTYLSQDDNGNTILTLYADMSGMVNYFNNVINTTTGNTMRFGGIDEKTAWSGGTTLAQDSLYPKNMYSTSLVRSKWLNNGGRWANSYSTLTDTLYVTDSTHILAPFTVSKAGEWNDITDFIVRPRDVSWQKLETNIILGSESNGAPRSNEGWEKDDPRSALFADMKYNYTSKELYDVWKNDFVWLPSLAEVGLKTEGIWGNLSYIKTKLTYNYLGGGRVYGAYFRSATPNAESIYIFNTTTSTWHNAVDYSAQTGSVKGVPLPALHLNISAILEHMKARELVDAQAVDTEWNDRSNPKILYAGEELKKGVDYDIVEGSLNTGNVLGNTTVQIRPNSLGEYEGENATLSYSLYRSLETAGFSFTVVPSEVEWTGEIPKLKVSVHDDFLNYDLVEQQDFTISVTNKEIGNDLLIAITGTGSNYRGQTTTTFNIVARSLSADYITVTMPTATQKYDGTDKRPKPTLVDEGLSYTLKEGEDYVLSYSNNTSAGRATIKITAMGSKYAGERYEYFDIATVEMKSCSIVWDTEWVEGNGNYLYNGSAIMPRVHVSSGSIVLQETRDYEISYTKAGIDVKYPTEVGNYLLVLTGKGNFSGTATKAFSIIATTLSSEHVSLTETSFIYNGQDQKPTYNVQVGGVELSPSDYSVTLRMNTPTGTVVQNAVNAGTYYYVFVGKGQYSGTVQKSFVIEKASLIGAKVTFRESEFVWKGSAIRPEISSVMTNTENNNLVVDSDNYDISYVNNTGAGVASIVLIAKNDSTNFRDSVQASFDITPGKYGSLTIQFGDFEQQNIEMDYDGVSRGMPVLTVTDIDGEVIGPSDYTVTYIRENVPTIDFVSAGTIIVTVTSRNNNGHTNYTGALSGSIKIKELNLDDNAEITIDAGQDCIYTGGPIQPTFRVTYLGTPIDSSNYDYQYFDNVRAGKQATITVWFKKNYSGQKSKTFEISAKEISSATVQVETIQDQRFTGGKIEPGVIIKDSYNGAKFNLAYGIDYEVTYSNNNLVGTATATIRGKGNYTGSRTETFKIIGRDIKGATITVTNVVYDGTEKKQTVNVSYGNTTLKLAQDYTCDYEGEKDNLIDAQTVTVTITALPNRSIEGTTTVTYQILPKSISDAEIEFTQTELVYDAEDKEPTFTAQDPTLSRPLTDADFEAVYSNNINAGTNSAVLTLIGIGNYKDSVSKYFSIDKAKIALVTLKSDTAVYTGNLIDMSILNVTTANHVSVASTEYAVSYTNADGNNDRIAAGTYTITVTANAESNNFEGSASATFTITPATITSVSLTETSVVYDGSAHRPTISQVLAGDISLKAGEYAVSYSRDGDVETEFVNAGTITVTITANGNNFKIEDEISTIFTIEKRNIENSDLVTVKYYKMVGGQPGEELGEDSSQVFIGTQVVPELSHKDGKKLVSGQDYEVAAKIDGEDIGESGYEHTGTYTLTITATEKNYTGTISKEYKVIAAEFVPENISYEVVDKTYTGEAVKLNLGEGIEPDELILGENADIILTYTDKGADQPPQQQRKLKYGTDFEVYQGETYTLKLNDGDSQTTTITLTDGYFLNIDAGQANLFLQGLGDYGDEEHVYRVIFKILPADIKEDEFEFEIDSAERIYKGKNYEPKLSKATWKGTALNESVDYFLTYKDNLKASVGETKAKVVINGTNNFKGVREIAFDIKPRDVSTVTVSQLGDITYDRKEHKREVSLSYNADGDSLALILDTDYTVEYQRLQESEYVSADNFTNAGTIKILITGQGNYSGTTDVTYSILPRSIEDGSVLKPGRLSGGKYHLNDQVYSNSEIKPTISLSYDGAALNADEITVTYQDGADFVNANPEISISVVGKGNYTGSLTFVYAILAKNLNAEGIEITLDIEDAQVTYTGKEIKFEVTVKDGESKLLATDFDLDWKDNTNVSYDASGNVDQRAAVIVKGKGNYAGSVTKHFKISPLEITDESVVAGEIDNAVYDGKEHRLLPSLTLNEYVLVEGKDFTADFGESDLFNAGTVSVTLKGVGNFAGTTEAFTYQIEKVDISQNDEGRFNFEIQGFQEDMTYTGSDIIFAVKVTDTVRGQELVFGSVLNDDVEQVVFGEFIVKYENNHDVSYDAEVPAKKAKIIITGIGNNYEGSYEQLFRIVPRSLQDSENVDILIAEIMPYTGEEIKPPVTVLLFDKPYSSEGNFDVEYSNNTQVGTDAQAKITGKGNFSGTVTKTFEIVKGAVSADEFEITIVTPADDIIYTGKEIIPEITVKLKDHEENLSQDEYQVQCSQNVNVGSSALVVVFFIKNYSGTCQKTFTIKPRNLDDVTADQIPDITFDGDNHIVVPSMKYVQESYQYSLVENRDFTYSYNVTDFKKVQQIQISVNGQTNFTGTKTLTYNIVKKSLNDLDVVASVTQEDLRYNGKDMKPSFVVNYKNMQLSAETDFDVDFGSYKNAGEAKIVITAKGDSNYKDSKEIVYAIGQRELSFSMLQTIEDQTYTGRDITPTITLKYNEEILTSDTHFDVEFENNQDSTDSAKVTITAKQESNFFGSFEATFKIKKLSINNANIEGIDSEYTFKDSEVKPSFTVKVDGYLEGSTALQESRDYTVLFSDNLIDVGEKTVTIFGQNNFEGEKMATFTIKALDLSGSVLQGFEDEVNYNYGEQITQNFSLVRNGSVISDRNYIVSYEDNVYAGSAKVTIAPSSNRNLSGTYIKYFTIKKIDPTLECVNVPDIRGYNNQNVIEVVQLLEGDTPGTFAFTPPKISLGKNTYTYSFTPTDGRNYNVLTGRTIQITGLAVEIEGIDVESGKVYKNGDQFNEEDLTVWIVYNNGIRDITKDYTLNVHTGEFVSSEFGIVVQYSDGNKVYSKKLSVLRTRMEKDGIVVTSTKGFDDEAEIFLSVYENSADIFTNAKVLSINDKIIRKLFVIQILCRGEIVNDDTIVVLAASNIFDEKMDLWELVNGEFVSTKAEDGMIQLQTSQCFIALTDSENDMSMLIYIVIGVAALLLIVLIIVLIIHIHNRKSKQLSKTSNINKQQQNQAQQGNAQQNGQNQAQRQNVQPQGQAAQQNRPQQAQPQPQTQAQRPAQTNPQQQGPAQGQQTQRMAQGPAQRPTQTGAQTGQQVPPRRPPQINPQNRPQGGAGGTPQNPQNTKKED